MKKLTWLAAVFLIFIASADRVIAQGWPIPANQPGVAVPCSGPSAFAPGAPAHLCGTMRMSGNATGVVDTNLKFEAYDNLYCADPSVWPFIPAANPSLTLVALSLRLADHLQARIT